MNIGDGLVDAGAAAGEAGGAIDLAGPFAGVGSDQAVVRLGKQVEHGLFGRAHGQAYLGGRHRDLIYIRLVEPDAFVGEKEEGAVALDRAAERWREVFVTQRSEDHSV